MGGVVVEHDVDLRARRLGRFDHLADRPQELDELPVAVLAMALADHDAGLDQQRREKA